MSLLWGVEPQTRVGQQPTLLPITFVPLFGDSLFFFPVTPVIPPSFPSLPHNYTAFEALYLLLNLVHFEHKNTPSPLCQLE